MIREWWYHVKVYLNTVIFSQRRSIVKRYVFSVICVVSVWTARSILANIIGVAMSYLLSIAVILSAWYGGFGPGILATTLLGILNYFFILVPNYDYFSKESLLSTFVFFLAGFLISVVSEARRQAELQKDEFIGFASHELKNPLATIKGYADIIRLKATKDGNKQYSHFATRIGEQVNRASSFITDLLDLSHIETGRISYNDETFNIKELISDTVNDQKRIHKGYKIVFSGGVNKEMYGDKIRIGQVLINLISNAVKYSPKGVQIVVKCVQEKKKLLITIQDHGMGINEANKYKIFNRFFRTEQAIRENVQGSGLGLYISSEIVRRHHGKIWVKSKVGRGSIFYFSLPIYSERRRKILRLMKRL